MHQLSFLALLLTAVSNLALLEAERVFCVPNSTKRSCADVVECSEYNTIQLEDINSRSEESLEIRLCSTEYHISGVPTIQLINLQSIIFTGNGITINCLSQQFGFCFQNVSRVVIDNVTLHQCRFEIEEDVTGSGNVVHFFASIYIADSSNISLNNVQIQSSPGFGLVLLRNHGYINISDSQFEGYHDSNFCEGLTYYMEHSSIVWSTLDHCLWNHLGHSMCWPSLGSSGAIF